MEILLQFLLPILLSILTAWQTIKVKRIEKEKDAAEEKLNELEVRAKTQQTIFEMLNRYEEEYAELNEKFLNLRKLYNEQENERSGKSD